MEFTVMEAKTRQHRFIIIVLALFASSGFVLEAYEQGWNWTGFLTKTLWDWLQLLGVLGIPVMVGVGVAWFSYRQNLNASQIAEDQQREDALQAYLDNISELLLKEHLGDLAQKSRLTAEHEEARQIARARTLAVLPRLDRERKRSLLLFLYEAHLINLFDWNSADLTEAALHEATFIGANLSRAKLNGADLTGTDLSGANLSNADLGRANLAGADLQRADLSGTQLDGARLNGANLSDANLSGADLSDASLSKAMLWGTKSRLQQQRQMVDEHLKRGGRMWKQVLYWRVNVTSVLDQFLGMSTLTIMFKNGTNLRGANLRRANLRGADLSDANLERAYLREADLTQTNLRRANLKGANLTDAKMSRAKRTVVVIPLNTEVKMGTEHLEWADLEKGSSYSLPGGGVLSTREAKNLLEKSSGNKARLMAVHFKPFSLRVVKLEAETTNLQEANLTDIDLTGIDLSGVNLYKVMVTSEQLGKAQSLKGTILPNGTKHSW
jgi:uncharacterized protein YjbI with pentapeptide repeats